MKRESQRDPQTTVHSLREEVREFVRERDWEGYHSPKNLGMSIAIEAAEIMELFQWYSTAESRELIQDEEVWAQLSDELADVMIYCLCLANAAGIDISTAVQAKLERSRSRYPVGYMPTKRDTRS